MHTPFDTTSLPQSGQGDEPRITMTAGDQGMTKMRREAPSATSDYRSYGRLEARP